MTRAVLLAGGTGGARLARGMQDLLGDGLTVIANTGDDIEIYGAHVSPDPDLILYGLAGLIDDRGWGIAGDTFAVMEGLRALGEDVWFQLGDRDLAVCIDRARRLAHGDRLTDALLGLRDALGVGTRVLPMSDDPVRTWVRVDGQSLPFQEFMVRRGAAQPIEGVELRGAQEASAPAEVLQAIAGAEVIVIGPSNPIVSIGPILAVREIREALQAARASIVAVSPFVRGRVIKGPTATFMSATGHEANVLGVIEIYGDLLDGILGDEPIYSDHLASLCTDVLMDSSWNRARVASETVTFAASLRK